MWGKLILDKVLGNLQIDIVAFIYFCTNPFENKQQQCTPRSNARLRAARTYLLLLILKSFATSTHNLSPSMVLRQSSTMSTSTSPHTLTSTETYTHLSVTLCSFAIIANTFSGDGEPLIACFAFSMFAFSATYAMIRWLGPTFMKAGLKGADRSKVHKKEIPETMGAVCAVVYIMVVICFIPFPFYKDIVEATSGGGNRDSVKEIHIVETGRFLHRFPHSKVSE